MKLTVTNLDDCAVIEIVINGKTVNCTMEHRGDYVWISQVEQNGETGTYLETLEVLEGVFGVAIEYANGNPVRWQWRKNDEKLIQKLAIMLQDCVFHVLERGVVWEVDGKLIADDDIIIECIKL